MYSEKQASKLVGTLTIEDNQGNMPTLDKIDRFIRARIDNLEHEVEKKIQYQLSAFL